MNVNKRLVQGDSSSSRVSSALKTGMSYLAQKWARLVLNGTIWPTLELNVIYMTRRLFHQFIYYIMYHVSCIMDTINRRGDPHNTIVCVINGYRNKHKHCDRDWLLVGLPIPWSLSCCEVIHLLYEVNNTIIYCTRYQSRLHVRTLT